jgi:endonuclease YncB( thermonuclease family)
VNYRIFSVGGAAFSAIFLCCGVSSAQTFSARVVRIVNGDTVEVVDSSHRQREIRLEGIDAPKREQPYANESTQHLGELLASKSVSVDCNRDVSYAPLVCKVSLPRTADDVDLEQIKAGMAWHYKQFQRLQTATDRAAYRAAEDAARRAHVGLWADPHPVNPDDIGTRTRRPVALKILITELLARMRPTGQ